MKITWLDMLFTAGFGILISLVGMLLYEWHAYHSNRQLLQDHGADPYITRIVRVGMARDRTRWFVYLLILMFSNFMSAVAGHFLWSPGV